MLQPGASVVLDTETHDLYGRVMDIAVIDSHTGEILLNTLVNPEIPVTAEAFDVHHISDAMVDGAPTWDQVLPEVLRVTEGRTVLAYKEEYDRTVIKEDCRRLGLKPGHLGKPATWECLMQARADWEESPGYARLGGDHRALGDAVAALDLLKDLAGAPPWARSRTEKVSA
ncbi:hypothetical protein AN218_05545 [Streptomyces nanshensis]|uniref:Exonuclease domain-containing protein n=2 Tax=Streptomyces nanshensis TaxID=518642 RepID=A0A1E7LA97_9ACTN|nr:hypothetical protein AN218_05545 [Streptomyces nanshensis]